VAARAAQSPGRSRRHLGRRAFQWLR
jgi:hypothetical protein